MGVAVGGACTTTRRSTPPGRTPTALVGGVVVKQLAFKPPLVPGGSTTKGQEEVSGHASCYVKSELCPYVVTYMAKYQFRAHGAASLLKR